MIKATIISVDDAINSGRYTFKKCPNDISEYFGVVTGYTGAFCVECKKDNSYGYSSVVFTDNCNAILLPEEDSCYNDIGIAASLCIDNGWIPTGNIVFRGYYKPVREGRETYYEDASNEVMSIMRPTKEVEN